MYTTFFDEGDHKCIGYYGLVSGNGVQCNQFLIVDHGHAALIDPGGDLTFAKLYESLNNEISVKDLEYVIASHQDPCLLYTSPSPRDGLLSRMPSSA